MVLDADTKSSLPYRPSAGAMVFNPEGLVFVARRMPKKGAPEGDDPWWQMPQGGIDDGEDAETALKRELGEETGIHSIRILGHASEWYHYDLPPELIGVAWKGHYRGQKQMWFAALFEGAESEINLVPPPGKGPAHKQEFCDWRWVAPAVLIDLIVPFKRDVYRRVVEELSPLGPALKTL